jgi:hypothetical protein
VKISQNFVAFSKYMNFNGGEGGKCKDKMPSKKCKKLMEAGKCENKKIAKKCKKTCDVCEKQ